MARPDPEALISMWRSIEESERSLGLAGTLVRSHRPRGRRARDAACDMLGDHAAHALELLEPIGEGGMGIVFRARQAGLDREVAVKRLAVDDRGAVRQFIAESRIAGLVEHANVVPVHTLTTSVEGQPQLAMKLVRGKSLGELIHGSELPSLDELLRIFVSACNAVEYAHDRGFVHRDLKADNVMVGEFGQVFVLDWGIAAGLDREACDTRGIPHVTDIDGPAGTPGFMAPELACGDGAMQGPWTDVYLLGGMLHEMLTGRPRHDGDTIRTVLMNAVASEPYAYADGVPWELGEIANKATSADPEDRYRSVAQLRQAIEGYRAHRAAHAISEEGFAVLERLTADVKRFAQCEAGERDRLAREIGRAYEQAMFAFRYALKTWSGTRDADRGRQACLEVMMGHAIATADLSLAERVADEIDSPRARSQVDDLRGRARSTERELATLREGARRLDWSRLAAPLAGVFAFCGVLGASVLMATKYLIARYGPSALWINAGVWLAAACVTAIFAVTRLHGARVPGSLVSPRILGTWGAVALACLAVGGFNELRPVKLAHDMIYPALLVGVGFASMALQTRRWLLAPAAGFYLAAGAVAMWPDWGYEILASAWLTMMIAVGVALRTGATLIAEESGTS
jgi:serine/threonine-protein kinase